MKHLRSTQTEGSSKESYGRGHGDVTFAKLIVRPKKKRITIRADFVPRLYNFKGIKAFSQSAYGVHYLFIADEFGWINYLVL